MGLQGRHGLARVVGLHGEDAAPERALERVGRDGRRPHAPRRHGTGDLEPLRRDGGDVVRRRVDEDDRLAGAQEGGAERPADGAGAPDEDRIPAAAARPGAPDINHAQGPSSTARVSATATSQIASMSASGRS